LLHSVETQKKVIKGKGHCTQGERRKRRQRKTGGGKPSELLIREGYHTGKEGKGPAVGNRHGVDRNNSQ